MLRIMRVGAIAALAVAGIVGFSGGVSAQEPTGVINLHMRYCPPGAVDVFADCHGNPAAGIDVWVEDDGDWESPIQVTDEDGNASFEVEAGWLYTWNYDDLAEGAPAWTEDYITSYCSVEGGDGSDIEPKGGDPDPDNWEWYFEVGSGDVITCDAYFLDADLDPIHGGAETPNTGAGPMTTGTSAGFFLAGAVALGGLAVASRKRAFR